MTTPLLPDLPTPTWLQRFDELLEDYAGARAEVAAFNVTQRSDGPIRLTRPRLKALRDHVAALASREADSRAAAGVWIPVSERLPAPRQSVALANVDRWENVGGDGWERNVHACGYLEDWGGTLLTPHWSIRGERATTIEAFTHWLALPAPGASAPVVGAAPCGNTPYDEGPFTVGAAAGVPEPPTVRKALAELVRLQDQYRPEPAPHEWTYAWEAAETALKSSPPAPDQSSVAQSPTPSQPSAHNAGETEGAPKERQVSNLRQSSDSSPDAARVLASSPEAPPAPVEPVEKVYLVATGETHEGAETYTRHEGAPPPLCDAECLYASPTAPSEVAQEPALDPMNYKGMFTDAVRALAEIDEILGLPADGCNDPQVTVSALKDYMAGIGATPPAPGAAQEDQS